jgi:hypothetical protein
VTGGWRRLVLPLVVLLIGSPLVVGLVGGGGWQTLAGLLVFGCSGGASGRSSCNGMRSRWGERRWRFPGMVSLGCGRVCCCSRSEAPRRTPLPPRSRGSSRARGGLRFWPLETVAMPLSSSVVINLFPFKTARPLGPSPRMGCSPDVSFYRGRQDRGHLRGGLHRSGRHRGSLGQSRRGSRLVRACPRPDSARGTPAGPRPRAAEARARAGGHARGGRSGARSDRSQGARHRANDWA